MQNRFLRNVSANSFQLIINQMFGLVIFYALSKGLSKNIFGEINWVLAVLLTVFGILTFGIDQITVKKIAGGENTRAAFSGYLSHVLLCGTAFYLLLLLTYFLLPGIFPQQDLLVFIGAGKLMIFFSNPFKQLAAGLEKFGKLFWMSIVSNIIRGTALLAVLLLNKMTVTNVIIIFIAGDIAELLLCIFIGNSMCQDPLRPALNKKVPFALLKESAPQAGVIVFTAVMSRFDWILIGLLLSGTSLAEYSFAWKVFEVATLPLLIIAPIMIPLFTRILKSAGDIESLSFFLEWQVIIASFIALLLNICWVPVIDFFTAGKYGAVNAQTVFLLSLSMPVLYFNNYLWTINFAKDRLPFIFSVMAVSFAVNITSCSILIPLFKNEGAAVANFLTVLAQFIFYLLRTPVFMPVRKRYTLLLWPLAALTAGLIAKTYFSNILIAVFTASLLFIATVALSKKIRLRDRVTLKTLYQ